MAVFMDLNICFSEDRSRMQKLVETAAHLGYSTVAVNYIYDPKASGRDREKIPMPTPIKDLMDKLPIVQGKSRPIRVLNRLTVVVSEPGHFRNTTGEFNRFDLLAVQPTTKELFQSACLEYEADLIVVPVTERLSFPFRRAPLGVALDRGLFFELSYSAAIRDSTMRKHTIANAVALMETCKGKGVILSSAAEQPLELRGPYDISNLGLLFCLSDGDSKEAVSDNCRSVILHSDTRRSAMGVISTKKRSSSSSLHQGAAETQTQTQQHCEESPAAKKKKPEEVIGSC